MLRKTLDAVRRLATRVIAPAHFFVAPDLNLEWVHREREETAWEIFRGRLLDPAHTRARAIFEAWSVFEKVSEGRSAEPVLSLKLDAATGVLYVVRGLECHVWEGYDSGGGVFLSRERRKWVRELVATLRLSNFADLDELRGELTGGLSRAILGASRLPLTSVEAPLPAFSFGRLFYCFREDAPEGAGPLRTWRDLLIKDVVVASSNPKEVTAHWLEFLLRAAPSEAMTAVAEAFYREWYRGFVHERRHLLELLRELFNGVSLTPWTDLVDKVLTLLRTFHDHGWLGREGEMDSLLTELGDAAVIDFLGHLLRQTGRHLTAYDLVTFHHRGANYPDALLLDLMLKEYLQWVERRPDLFADVEEKEEDLQRRHRRRALRQAWMVRRRYEGHPVPDHPTSPGENNRVLPPSHPRLSEEQVLQTTGRTKFLYDGDPLINHLGPRAADVLGQSIADLRHPAELRELGAGLFLDRPLGAPKTPGEPDASPLLASVAFSRAIAAQRVNALLREEVLAEMKPILDECLRMLVEAPPRGLPLERLGGASRPGAVSLTDAGLASPDFEFLWSMSAGLFRIRDLFDFKSMEEPFGDPFTTIDRLLLVRNPSAPGIQAYDHHSRLRLEFESDASAGWIQRRGVEYPAGGLLVTRVWMESEDGSLFEHDLRAAPIRLSPQT